MIGLLAESETTDCRSVALDILVRQIGKEPAPLSNQLQQTTTRMMIVLVGPEVISQTVDSLSEQCDLHFRRTSIDRVHLKLRNNRVFDFTR
jgi:hypothetical protein